MSIEVTRLSAADGRDISVIKSWFDANADELYKGIDCTSRLTETNTCTTGS